MTWLHWSIWWPADSMWARRSKFSLRMGKYRVKGLCWNSNKMIKKGFNFSLVFQLTWILLWRLRTWVDDCSSASQTEDSSDMGLEMKSGDGPEPDVDSGSFGVLSYNEERNWLKNWIFFSGAAAASFTRRQTPLRLLCFQRRRPCGIYFKQRPKKTYFQHGM